jgi:hypothetical protein
VPRDGKTRRTPSCFGCPHERRHHHHWTHPLHTARRALAAAKRVDEAKDIRDKAIAVAIYAKQARDRSLIEDATDIRLRAERRCGELLRQMAERRERAGDGRPTKRSHGATVFRLADLGVSKTQSSRWQSLATLDSLAFELHVTNAKKKAMNGFDGAHVRGTTEWSGEYERHTPKPYIKLARKVFGGRIDLDPASSEAAQRNVRASRYFTIVEDGLKQDWYGHVWLNPPYHRDLVGSFVEKLVREYTSGRVRAAILLVNNITDTEWFDAVVRSCASICFTHGRIQFLLPNGQQMDTPPTGQMFAYFGQYVDRFEKVFCAVGSCVRLSRQYRA